MSDLQPAGNGPRSRIEWVEQELRRAILGGEYQPGQRLLTVQLAEKYEVSPTPLREVLQRFAGEGLVDSVPQRGARVSQLTVRDGRELAALRGLLDGELLSGAVSEYHPQDWDYLQTAALLLRGAWQRDGGHSPGAEITYRAFFDRAGQANPSLRLRSQAKLVRELGARYRLVAAAQLTVDDLLVANDQLRDALLAESGPRIAEAVRAETRAFADAFVRVHEEDAPASAVP
jgi:GntR family transcriptional regulator, carbon starvation induced regulator